jgi:hypothetical protein
VLKDFAEENLRFCLHAATSIQHSQSHFAIQCECNVSSSSIESRFAHDLLCSFDRSALHGVDRFDVFFEVIATLLIQCSERRMERGSKRDVSGISVRSLHAAFHLERR